MNFVFMSLFNDLSVTSTPTAQCICLWIFIVYFH